MKKTMLMLVGGALLLATPACKKGANDPALSLKSRKGRLAGEYNITKWENNSTSVNGNNTATYSATFDGSTLIEKQTSGGTTITTTTPVSVATYTFMKDGTWSREWTDITTTETDYGAFVDTDVTNSNTKESGTWAFIGKTKGQSKNKERIQLSILKEETTTKTETTSKDLQGNVIGTSNSENSNAYTYSYLEIIEAYDIDMLKNKEMVFKLVADYTGSLSTTSGNTTTTQTYSWTGESIMTLTQK